MTPFKFPNKQPCGETTNAAIIRRITLLQIQTQYVLVDYCIQSPPLLKYVHINMPLLCTLCIFSIRGHSNTNTSYEHRPNNRFLDTKTIVT